MNPKHENIAWRTVQNSDMNYIHIETPEAENYNNNNYKHFKSQETKRTRHTHICTWAHMNTCAHACAHVLAHMHTQYTNLSQLK